MRYLEAEQLAESVMVLAPHQDDEVLLCAGILRQAKRLGSKVKVVIVTNGDCGCPDHTKGEIRLRETVKGMRKLGLAEEDLLFLGYADTGMPKKESFLWQLYEESEQDKVLASGCSDRTYGLPEMPEYHVKKWGEHALYTRRMIKQDLKSILAEHRPACLFTTCEEDTHGDHAGLYMFLQEILREMREEEHYLPEVFCGLVHSAAGDDFWPERLGGNFTCPSDFEQCGGLRWDERCIFRLPEEMTQDKGQGNLKYQALSEYETALEPNAYSFLMSFVKNEEIFWKMAE